MKTPTRIRIDRLEQLKGMLAIDEHATIPDLARELGVSGRTLARDVALLRDSGLPIEADRGRGGGVRLQRSWRMGRLQLDYAEAIDLLLSLAVAERFGSPLFLNRLAGIRHKVAGAFSDRQMDRIRDLRRRILIGERASPAVMATYAAPQGRGASVVAEAFFEKRGLDIDYRDGAGAVTTRRIEPHYLHYNPPVWYLLAFDHLRGDVRSFRIDRVVAARVRAEQFRVGRREVFMACAEVEAENL